MSIVRPLIQWPVGFIYNFSFRYVFLFKKVYKRALEAVTHNIPRSIHIHIWRHEYIAFRTINHHERKLILCGEEKVSTSHFQNCSFITARDTSWSSAVFAQFVDIYWETDKSFQTIFQFFSFVLGCPEQNCFALHACLTECQFKGNHMHAPVSVIKVTLLWK